MFRHTLLIIITLFLLSACNEQNTLSRSNRHITDALGREVCLPDTIRKIIAINESTMRMISYVGATDLVCGIEDVEIRGIAFTHIFANPEILKKPVIGPMYGGDPELIILQKPDIVIASNLGGSDADEMEQKLGIPVVVIQYGNMGDQIDIFYENLRLLGNLLDRQERADSLIKYIHSEIYELNKRSAGKISPEVYLGGISYRGRHDLLSTDPHYAPFEMVNCRNIADRIDSSKVPDIGNTTIDIETILKWNPEILFIDQGGYALVKENFRSFDALKRLLDCYKNQQIYLVWPYYMFHSNFEVMLINAWSIGKVLYPDQFADIDLKEKSDEILTHFTGKPVTEKLIEQWGWFRNITEEL